MNTAQLLRILAHETADHGPIAQTAKVILAVGEQRLELDRVELQAPQGEIPWDFFLAPGDDLELPTCVLCKKALPVDLEAMKSVRRSLIAHLQNEHPDQIAYHLVLHASTEGTPA